MPGITKAFGLFPSCTFVALVVNGFANCATTGISHGFAFF